MSKKLPSLCSPAFSSHHHRRHKFHSVSTGLSRTNRNFNVKREEGNRDSSCSLYLSSSPSLLKMLFPRYIEPEGKVVFYFSVLPFSVGVLWSRHDTLPLHHQLCYYTPRTPPTSPHHIWVTCGWAVLLAPILVAPILIHLNRKLLCCSEKGISQLFI